MKDKFDKCRSFENFYSTHFSLVFKIAFNIINDFEAAEEICQDSFIKFRDKAPDFPAAEQAKYWLIRVVKNMCFNALKRKTRENLVYKKISRIPEKTIKSGEEIVLEQETAEIVRTAFDKLPVKLREPLFLKEYGGLNYKEICKVLKISENNVKVRIFRARTALAELLNQEDLHVP